MLTKTLLFLSLLAVLFVVSNAQTNCVLFDNCDDCIASPGDGCGWCETTGLCLAGNSVGPGGVAANCTAWYYDSCLAVDCFRFTSCATCVNDQFCGWCGATSTCVEGGRSGPMTGTCSSGYVFGSSSQCPGSTSSTSSTTGRRTTSTTTSSSSSSTSGRRSSGSTSGGSTSGGSTSGGSTGGSGSTSGGSTGGSGSTSGGSTGGSGSTSGASTGGSGSSSGRRSGSTGGSSSGRRGSTGSGSTGGSSSGGSSSGGSTSGGSTSGGSPPIFNSESSAFSLSPASFLVAVIVLAIVNLLW